MNKFGPSGEVKGNIIVGNDVWIGYGATLMEGVTVGDGAIIGAMAVVASDVPPYAIVIGNPAKILRYRFPPDRINEMLKLKWWDWQPEKIKENMGWLLGKTADLKGSQ